jgi:uncharacterized protein YfbU (UPF0304 family)
VNVSATLAFKLSPFERLLLINQLEIRKAIDRSKAQDFDYKIEVLRNGYEEYNDRLIDGFASFSERDSRFVSNVLGMYQSIEDSKRDHPEDTEVKTAPFSHFSGFDGNDEGDYLGLAEFLFEDERWADSASYRKNTDGFNIHMPTVDIYRRMLAQFDELNATPSEGPIELSREQVLAILTAAKHPASR